MRVVNIKGKEYNFVQSWDSVTLAEVKKVSEIKIPEDLLKEYKELIKDGYEGSFDFDKYVDYYRAVMNVLTDIPNIDIPDREVIDFYHAYLFLFVLDIIIREPATYQPKEIESFKINGETYNVPKKENIAGIDVEARNLKIVQYREASDLLKGFIDGSPYEMLALFVACYCLKEGEEFSEELILSRYKDFYSLPMSTVWDVFFYISELTTGYMKDLEVLTKEGKQTQKVLKLVEKQDSMILDLLAVFTRWLKRVFVRSRK